MCNTKTFQWRKYFPYYISSPNIPIVVVTNRKAKWIKKENIKIKKKLVPPTVGNYLQSSNNISMLSKRSEYTPPHDYTLPIPSLSSHSLNSDPTSIYFIGWSNLNLKELFNMVLIVIKHGLLRVGICVDLFSYAGLVCHLNNWGIFTVLIHTTWKVTQIMKESPLFFFNNWKLLTIAYKMEKPYLMLFVNFLLQCC